MSRSQLAWQGIFLCVYQWLKDCDITIKAILMPGRWTFSCQRFNGCSMCSVSDVLPVTFCVELKSGHSLRLVLRISLKHEAFSGMVVAAVLMNLGMISDVLPFLGLIWPLVQTREWSVL